MTPNYRLIFISKNLTPEKLDTLIAPLTEHNITPAVKQPITPINDDISHAHFQVALTAEQFNIIEDHIKPKAHAEMIDVVCLPTGQYDSPKRLIVFDMDSTVIEQEVIDELADCAGIKDQVAAITESAMRGEIEFKESFTQRLKLINELSEDQLHEVTERLTLTEGGPFLFTALKQAGIKTALVSGGFDFFAKRIQQMLGIDYVHANQLRIEDNKVYGEPVGDIVDGEMKAKLLKEMAQAEGISLNEVVAVGDGANDIPMMMTAGMGVAFHAKPLVQQQASCALNFVGLDGVIALLKV